MPENPFAPTDFSTDFMDDPSATEDRHTKKYHSLPTTWLYGLVGAEDWAPSWIKEGYNRSIEGQAYEWLHGSLTLINLNIKTKEWLMISWLL